MQPSAEIGTPFTDIHDPRRARGSFPTDSPRERQHAVAANYPSVERGIRTVSRRFALTDDQTDELRSQVWLKLLEQEGRVFRRFNGRSRLSTYLTKVIARIHLDGCRSASGRWRASAEARRTGKTALVLERLLMRDGLTFDEAYEVLKTNFRVAETREQLEALRLRLPVRAPRQVVGETALALIPSRDPVLEASMSTDHSLDASIKRALHQSIRSLSLRDRRILILRFQHDWTAPQIAEHLGVTSKTVYRRLDQTLTNLRSSLTSLTGASGAPSPEVSRPPVRFRLGS